MKTEISRSTEFIPVKLEITFESAWEMDDFTRRLEHDSTLPNSAKDVIQKLRAFPNRVKSISEPRKPYPIPVTPS